MQKPFDAIKEAGHLVDLSNTKQSTDVSQYYLNDSVHQKTGTLPVMTYGLQLDRLSDAPPPDLIDTESHLKNQFDILSKSGYVYKRDEGALERSSSMTQPSSNVNDFLKSEGVVTSAESFFNPVSGRDYHKFSSKSCNDINIWRDDISTANRPMPKRFDHVDTRAILKRGKSAKP